MVILFAKKFHQNFSATKHLWIRQVLVEIVNKFRSILGDCPPPCTRRGYRAKRMVLKVEVNLQLIGQSQSWRYWIEVWVHPHTPGHSILTKPICSVLRFLPKFGSQKIGTDRFFSRVGTKDIRFRFGSGYIRKNRSISPQVHTTGS